MQAWDEQRYIGLKMQKKKIKVILKLFLNTVKRKKTQMQSKIAIHYNQRVCCHFLYAVVVIIYLTHGGKKTYLARTI